MVNTSVLIGWLTADPTLKYTPNNVPVLAFVIAVNRPYAKAGEEANTNIQ